MKRMDPVSVQTCDSTGHETGQRLNHNGDEQAHDQSDKSFDEVVAENFAEVSTGMVRKDIVKFIFFNAQGNLATAKQAQEDPRRTQRERRKKGFIKQTKSKKEVNHRRRSEIRCVGLRAKHRLNRPTTTGHKTTKANT